VIGWLIAFFIPGKHRPKDSLNPADIHGQETLTLVFPSNGEERTMKITDVTSAINAAQFSVSRLGSGEEPPAIALAGPGPSAAVDEATLRQEVDAVNAVLQKSADEHLQFSVHQESNRIVVKLVNAVTHEVVREMPSEKFLDLVADLMKLAGIQVDETR
jgi:flagellar protein FlaG